MHGECDESMLVGDTEVAGENHSLLKNFYKTVSDKNRNPVEVNQKISRDFTDHSAVVVIVQTITRGHLVQVFDVLPWPVINS